MVIKKKVIYKKTINKEDTEKLIKMINNLVEFTETCINSMQDNTDNPFTQGALAGIVHNEIHHFKNDFEKLLEK